MESVNQEITIDKDFERQLFPLSPVEFSHLEQSIASDGCREKLIVWRQQNILVDGHNRYQICKRLGASFEIELRDFESRESVADFIDRNQAGRRNCSPEDYQILTGRIYNRRKKTKAEAGAIGRSSSSQNGNCLNKTCDIVANEFGLSKNTILRNGERAAVFDAMMELGDEQAADAAKSLPQKEILAVKDKPAEQAAEELKKKHVHVSANSGEQDWYTPPQFLEAARGVLGKFDTDPASSETAQQLVKAKTYFTSENNGLEQKWRGRVWMNPPYSNGLVEKFAEKLIDELNATRVNSAIVLVNNATETKWFQRLLEACDAVCFVRGRIKFLDSNLEPKKTPLQGQAFLYFGQQSSEFLRGFDGFGVCVRAR